MKPCPERSRGSIPVLAILTALLALWTLTVFALVPSVAEGAVPQLINFQGILRDGSGNPVANGSYSVRFRIYDDALAGNVLWSESTSVSTTSGLFTVLLGALTPVPDTAFNNPDRWLGIKVGGDAEMAPRQKLTSVGYTFRTEQWTSAAQDLFRLNGRVGIGTTSPAALLQVHTTGLDQQIYVSSGAPSVTLGNNESRSSATMRSAFVLATENGHYGLNAGDALLYNLGDSRGDIYINSNYYGAGTKNVIIQPSSGNVTIGTTTPFNPDIRLSVHDDGTTNAIAVGGVATGFDGTGVIGVADNGTGAAGVYGSSTSGDGVVGYSSTSDAGFFVGKVQVTGFLTKSGGGFKIDHPLDPANQYLYHSFVESPDMMNIYNGNVTLDSKGEAVIALSDWFGALNKDFRYQLTCIGGFAQVYVAEKVKGNRFKIAGGTAGLEVSWQVTGIRQDAYANAHRIPVEELKSDKERGYYLHPDLFGQPEEKGVEWARHPEMMKEMKERRLQVEKK